MNNNYSVSNEGSLIPTFKQKYQDKLETIVTEICNDPEGHTVTETTTFASQQEYVLQAVHYLIEVDKTGDLMRVLVENFGEELSDM